MHTWVHTKTITATGQDCYWLWRSFLVVCVSSFTNTSTLGGPLLNLLYSYFSHSVCGLLVLTAAVQPYKKKMNNAMFYLTLLILFSAANLYATHRATGIKNGDCIYIVLVGAAFNFLLGTCAITSGKECSFIDHRNYQTAALQGSGRKGERSGGGTDHTERTNH